MLIIYATLINIPVHFSCLSDRRGSPTTELFCSACLALSFFSLGNLKRKLNTVKSIVHFLIVFLFPPQTTTLFMKTVTAQDSVACDEEGGSPPVNIRLP